MKPFRNTECAQPCGQSFIQKGFAGCPRRAGARRGRAGQSNRGARTQPLLSRSLQSAPGDETSQTSEHCDSSRGFLRVVRDAGTQFRASYTCLVCLLFVPDKQVSLRLVLS